MSSGPLLPEARASLRPSAAAAVATALLAAVLLLLPGGRGDGATASAGELSVTAVEARTALDRFTLLLNDGRVGAGLAMTGGSLEDRPEAIDGFAVNPLLDFDQEYRYLEWTAALGGQRVISSCTVSRWRHLVGGVRIAEDAQLLSCAGTFTNDFFAAIGLAPAPTEVTMAVGPGSRIILYKERVLGVEHTRSLLAFRRWLWAHHPEHVGAIFSPGGTPVTSPDSARLMLDLVAGWASGP